MPFGGPVTLRTLVPAVKERPTWRWSMSKACVTAPFRIRTTLETLAASGVCTWNAPPYPMIDEDVLVMVGRVAGVPFALKRYAGE